MEKIIDKYKIEIIPDIDPESPREWCNLGTMVCFHNRYNLGDKSDYRDKTKRDFNSWDEVKREIVKNENVCVILPLYLYDHSGITMNTTGFSCRWDSGQVGFIFVSKWKIYKEYGKKRISKQLREKVKGYLESEVKTYDQYLTGEVYGYRITNTETDEEIDNCWGFIGSEDDCMIEAENEVKAMIRNRPQLELKFTE